MFTRFSTYSFRRWFWRSLFGIGILLLLTVKSNLLFQFATQAAPAPPLVISTRAVPSTFNFALNSVFPNIFLFTYTGLTQENGATGAVEPALAETWQSATNGKRWVFTLRRGLKWSDGKPLTAEDVVFTYQDIIANRDIPTDLRDALQIGSGKQLPTVRKLNDFQVEFTLPEPFAPFLRATAGIAILPKHALASSLRTRTADGQLQFLSTWGIDSDPTQIVVNGPYKVARYIPDQQITFQRNPYYWRKDAAGNALPRIQQIDWRIDQRWDTELQQFLSGQLDVIGDLRPLQLPEITQLKEQAASGNFRLYDGGARSGTLFLTFNLTQARNELGKALVDPVKSRWFKQREFRQAVAYALDRATINREIFGNLGFLQNSPLPMQSPYFLQQGLKTYEYNPDQSRKILQRAGFRYNLQRQLLDSQGNRVRFTLLTNAENARRVEIANRIKQDLAAIGIQVDLSILGFNTLIDKLYSAQNWDAVLISFTGEAEPHNGANLWMSDGGVHLFNLKPQPGQRVMPGWQITAWERKIDQLFRAAAQEMDETKRKQLYGEFQQLVQEQAPVIHLVGDRAIMAANKRVQGIKPSGLVSWGLWNLEELTLDPITP